MLSVQSRMARGAVWMFAARWVDKLLGLVSTLVLARLLAPGDFGIVAISTAVIVLLEAVTNFSFDTALMQHRSPTREHVTVCAADYCGTVLATWRLCGSPVGAETFVLDRLLRVLRIR